ncbi:MAG: isoleucine--tRNA ligase [Deltaproteobacteria bacterium]|nr:isoleucine--tRNA ligase [Deltaproteobacteria bacterium]
MFEPVSPQVSFPALDERCLTLWKEQDVFAKTVARGEGKPSFVFYEGPPTANGMPHPGHVLTRVMKDVFLRYRSMCGYHVPRRAGWDTHGLPVEVEVEKALGINGKDAIAEYGVEAFSQACIDSVFRYIDEWRRMTTRIGFWVDLDDAYVTFHRSYVESVWWALSQLFEQGMLYKGYKVVWWWPQGGTALSAGEVGQGYKQVDDPSVVVRFRVVGEERTSLLAWTTTPWTLPSNIALAVDPKLDYACARLEDGERVWLAAARIEAVLGEREYEVVATKTGAELVGLRYDSPFHYAEPQGGPAHQVIVADFVTLDTGTGMVHLAPAFGEDDFRVCKAQGLGFLQLVRPDGIFPEEVTDFAGRFVKDADRDIVKLLDERGLLFAQETYRHDYPFCWRKMDDPLIQYARRSWFIKTTREIERVKANNQAVHWEPAHIKDGRFGQFLEGNVDWALSRERFWGTPLPIWVNDETGTVEAVGSVDAILEKNADAFAEFDAAKADNPELSEHLRVHKPWIDNVTWTKPGEPGTYRRVPEVIDCWFDSGCMPFAQWGYPHQNKDKFEAAFPADFITEAVDQTRGWFYSLMTISTLMFPDAELPHPFKNCFVMGLVTDAKGKKLSKRDKNYTDPLVLMDEVGADAMRWSLYTGTVPGQNTRFGKAAAEGAAREFLLKLWNVYSFFVTYARIDGFEPSADAPDPSERSDMDRYILAELDHTIRRVREELDQYRSHLAARALGDFVDALSNWYVRRSRARFWAEGDSVDKRAAFATLYEVLSETSLLLAPFVPFMAEEMFQNLVRAQRDDAEVSVHLEGFPEAREERRDDSLREAVEATRDVVALGQRVRNETRLKVRQPLSRAIVVTHGEAERAAIARFAQAIREELNVRELEFTNEPERYVEYVLVPNFRVLGPRVGRRVPAVKAALSAADGSALHAEMSAHGKVTLDVEGETLELGPEEVEVRLTAKPGFAAAAEGERVLLLDTEITPELKRAGLAREVVNRVQRARKELELAFEARIDLRYQTADAALAEAIEAESSFISEQTLAESLVHEGGGTHAIEVKVDGAELRLWITPRE